MSNKQEKIESLKEKWADLVSANKKIRIRDAAKQLNVSEAELLSTSISKDIFLLSIKDYSSFFKEILCLDKIMLLIRSDFVVHEKIIDAKSVEIKNNNFIYKDRDSTHLLNFDTNLFKYSFYESRKNQKINLKSFQFFNSHGNAVLKIYLKGDNSKKFSEIALKHKIKHSFELPSSGNCSSKLQNLNLKNDVDLYFKNISKEFKKTKCDLKKNPLREILINASKSQTPIQIHALGLGTIQYHKDTIKKVIDYGPWINIIDKNFNLHVLEKKLNKFILTKYSNQKTEYCLIDFFDQNKDLVLGISSIKGSENKFARIVNNLGDSE